MFVKQTLQDLFEDARSLFDSSTQQDYLRRELAGVNYRLTTMKDPELGAVGPALCDAFAATGCAEDVDPALSVHAGFVPADNAIVYGMDDLRERRQLLIDRLHEGNHAIQWGKSAALHADPSDDNVDVILCPRDYVRAMVLAEKDTRAKQTWLLSLAAKNDFRLKSAAAPHQISVSSFNRLRRKTHSLQQALYDTARDTLNIKGRWMGDSRRAETKFEEFYAERYLNYYANAIRSRGAGNFTVTRMSDKDALAIGGAFGPNSFADADGNLDRDFLDVKLSSEQKRLIAALNKVLGVKNEDSLPLLEDALKEKGHTPESFIAAAKPVPTRAPPAP